MPRRWVPEHPQEIARLVQDDMDNLRAGNVTPTRGDMRCIVFGHLTRLAIWNLRKAWDRTRPIHERLEGVAGFIGGIGGPQAVEQFLKDDVSQAPKSQREIIREAGFYYGVDDDEISF